MDNDQSSSSEEHDSSTDSDQEELGVDQTPPENNEQNNSPQTEEEQIEALLNMGHEIEREGKEFVSIRSSGLISPNRYTTKRYLEGYEGVLIFYNESNNTLVIKPVNNYEPDEGRKFPLNLENSDAASFSAATLFGNHNIEKPDENHTHRYYHDWDDELEALFLDLDEDPEVFHMDRSSTNNETEDEAETKDEPEQ